MFGLNRLTSTILELGKTLSYQSTQWQLLLLVFLSLKNKKTKQRFSIIKLISFKHGRFNTCIPAPSQNPPKMALRH